VQRAPAKAANAQPTAEADAAEAAPPATDAVQDAPAAAPDEPSADPATPAEPPTAELQTSDDVPTQTDAPAEADAPPLPAPEPEIAPVAATDERPPAVAPPDAEPAAEPATIAVVAAPHTPATEDTAAPPERAEAPPEWLRTPVAAPPDEVPAPVAADADPALPPDLAAPADDADQTLAWPGEDDALTQAQASLAASLAPPPVPAEAALAAGLRREPGLSDLPPPVSAPVQRMLAAARAGRAAQSAPPAPRLVEATPPGLTEKMQKAIGKATKGTKGKPKPPAPRPSMAPPPPPLPPSASQPHVPPAKSEAEKMTVFGERRAPVRGKPRFLGLILTGVLLAILLGVAIWAAAMLDPQQSSAAKDTTPQIASAVPAPSVETPAPVAALPATTDSAAPLEADPVVLPEAVATDAPAEAEPVAAAPEEPAVAPVVASTGDAATDALATAGSATVEEVTLPLPDPALAEPQRMRLADLPPGATDPAPASPGALQEFGALYQFDADGNILPTPEGVITPDGVRLVAGRPDRVPPARPEPQAADVATATPDPATPTAAPTAPAPTPGAIAILPAPAQGTEAASAFQPDTAAPRRRPPERPATLEVQVPAPPQAPVADEGALPVPAPNAFTSSRPPARSAVVLAAARSAEAERAREVAAAAAAAAASASTALAAETAGLAATRRPAARPATFSRTIEAAVAAAIAPPVATPQRNRAAAPEPAVAAAPQTRGTPRFGAHPDEAFEDDGEPDVVAAAPSAPTRASVARQATVSGALNLGRTNLIGVFGTANARYALVRESGGRLVRVTVGDRVDGGRVVAIGAADLRYQRGGQTVRLEMPRS
ncbi:MAG: hypothetical protein Q8K20_06235, partial [Gemmobacter sp.]|nr:hypothetical protein [Gemmobacter sp.]